MSIEQPQDRDKYAQHFGLAASTRELSALLDHLPAMVAFWDKDLRNRFANQAYVEWFGAEPAQMLGMHIRDLLGPTVYEMNLPYIQSALAGEPQQFERTLVDTLGHTRHTRHTQASYTPYVVDGRIEGFFVLVTDVTALKNAEEQLRERNVELERMGRTKNMFVANMSHELRTPLNAIMGFTGMLLMRLPGPLTPDQERQLTTIKVSGEHLLSLISDLLDLAKIEAGSEPVTIEPVDCGAVAEKVVASLQPLAMAKGLALVAAVPDSPSIAMSDARALNQILMNLVNNAIKFTDAGRVTVTLRLADSDWVQLAVTDTGPGIPTDDLETIFNAFERGHGKIANQREGTGLGLHICHKLAELIGATITVDSDLGTGSTFQLELPAARADNGSQPATSVADRHR